MMRALRILILLVISAVPLTSLRRQLYRRIFGFQIAHNASVGMFCLLDIRNLVMEEHSRIRGFGNVFLCVSQVKLKAYARIGGPRIGLNIFRGVAGKTGYPESAFVLGRCSVIELLNYFDLCSSISFGDNVVLGGIRSVFFTHTFFEQKFMPIEICNNVFIGSNCLFQMNTKIPSNSVVGIGSIVVGSIEEGDSFIAGSPAKVAVVHYGYDAPKAFALRNLVYFDGKNFNHPPKKA